jgi:mono/diheme cytochrome c family protein
MLYRCWLLAPVFVFATAALAAPAQSPPGLIGTFQSQNSQPDLRILRLPALYVPAGTPSSTFTTPGPFTAKITGNLELRLRDELSFSLVGRGSIKLSINGQKILELSGDNWRHEPTQSITLNKGKNPLLIEYTSPESGDAFFRLYWSSSDFPPEPIPPTSFTHEKSTELESASSLREGRFLFANLRCFKCHTDNNLAPAIDAATRITTDHGQLTTDIFTRLPMPELAIDAPSFEGVGSRLNESWIAHWISNPKALRHNATMPRVFGDAKGNDSEIDGRVRDLAAHLATLTSEKTPEPAFTDEMVASGGRLFAHRHCNACHTLPDAEKIDLENGRTPLNYVKAKYKPAALVAFLKNPQQHYAWIRMPNFKFSDTEAQRLAAFLLSRPQKSREIPASAKQPNPEFGKVLLTSSGCLNCHTLEKTPSTLKAPALTKADSGCLSPQVSGKAPFFAFAPDQIKSLASFIKTDRSSLLHEALPEFAQRQILNLRCTACHTRDSTDDLYSQLTDEVDPLISDGVDDEPGGEGDERIAEDQSEPILTWAGEKLKPEWTTQLLLGKLDYRLRPWLRARMPAFPARANLLAHALPLEHGFAPTSAPPPTADASLVPFGRKLLSKDGGFACTTCHGVGSLKPVGVFEAPGPNLQYVNERLNPHYFARWVYNPLRVHKDTKMPAFADKDGKTSLRETLDGDARKQYQAIYDYLLAGRKVEPPEN